MNSLGFPSPWKESYDQPAAAAAKSLQSCPTLCDPIDGSPPGSPRPWGSPGKNTGVGCNFLLQCMKVKSESEVDRSCPTLIDPMDCSLPGSSLHGIFQAKVLEWVANSFSRGSSWLRDQTRVFRIVGGCFTVWDTREVIQWRLGHFLNLLIKHCLLNLGLSKIILNSKKI